MLLLAPLHWNDYELLDAGDFEKLERFGKHITIRPEPQAVWNKILSENEWKQQADVKFFPTSSSTGKWKKFNTMPDRWNIEYKLPSSLSDKETKQNNTVKSFKFRLALTAFKHVGVFPEQAENWDYIFETITSMNCEKPSVLNLFAYTGGASLAAKAAGADVVHVDSIKQVVTWAKENMDLSTLSNIRWVVEDAMKFVKREVKRGKKYNGIILDPPAYGHGTNGETWKLEDNIQEMIKNTFELLDEKEHFLILNTYSLGFSSVILENLLKNNAGKKLQSGELYLQATTGVKLPLGVFGRFRTTAVQRLF